MLLGEIVRSPQAPGKPTEKRNSLRMGKHLDFPLDDAGFPVFGMARRNWQGVLDLASIAASSPLHGEYLAAFRLVQAHSLLLSFLFLSRLALRRSHACGGAVGFTAICTYIENFGSRALTRSACRTDSASAGNNAV